MRTIGRVLMLGACLAYAGCGSTSPKSTGSAIAPTRALSLPLTVLSAEGTVEGRTTRNAAFLPLEKGKSASDITGVQTRGGGAVLEFGDAERSRGRLWIKDGSSIDVGQDADGQVRVLVAKGEARLRDGARDVIFHPLSGKTEALDTSRHLSDADWSLALETKREPSGFGSLETRGENGEKGRLAIESVHVRAKRVGDFSETEVEHIFKNDSDRNLEGTFRFPVPDGAILIGFAMEVNDQL
ncbi:MAG: VIT domain-containing protein, partial [Polyangiaceae bacterium]